MRHTTLFTLLLIASSLLAACGEAPDTSAVTSPPAGGHSDDPLPGDSSGNSDVAHGEADAGGQAAERYFVSGPAPAVALSPDAITASNAVALSEVRALPVDEEGRSQWLRALSFSPDGSLLALGGDNGSFIWKLATGEPVDLEMKPRDMAFSADGQGWGLAYFGAVALYYLDDLHHPLFLEHADAVNSIAFSLDGLYLVTASGENVRRDFTVRLWDLRTGEQIAAYTEESSVKSVAFSPDSLHFASGNNQGLLTMREVGSDASAFSVEAHQNAIADLAFTPDGTLLASAGADGRIGLWDAATGEQLRMLEAHKDRVEGIAFSPDGTLLASVSRDGTFRLWTVTSGEPLQVVTVTPLEGSSPWLTGVAFSPDGSLLAIGGVDGVVHLWAVSGQ